MQILIFLVEHHTDRGTENKISARGKSMLRNRDELRGRESSGQIRNIECSACLKIIQSRVLRFLALQDFSPSRVPGLVD